MTSTGLTYGKSIVETYGPLMRNAKATNILTILDKSSSSSSIVKINEVSVKIPEATPIVAAQENIVPLNNIKNNVDLSAGEKLMLYFAYNGPKAQIEITDLLSDEELYNKSSISEIKLNIGDIITESHIELIKKYDPDFLKMVDLKVGEKSNISIHQYLNKKLAYYYPTGLLRDGSLQKDCISVPSSESKQLRKEDVRKMLEHENPLTNQMLMFKIPEAEPAKLINESAPNQKLISIQKQNQQD